MPEINTRDESSDEARALREELYRQLPSVSELLLTAPLRAVVESHGPEAVVRVCRAALEKMREEIAGGDCTQALLAERIEALPLAIAKELERGPSYSLRPVINATGVVLHTNLGRAPLSREALDHAAEVACGYSNLELDLESGERGKRDVHVESLLVELLGEELGNAAYKETHRAIVVNNCAAATFLALHALAKGREVIVSRGELIEIGGGFRIPQILEESGAVLKEVGTTNRTRIGDYERAITTNTAVLLRVHPSNFSMEGFVERAPLEDLIALGESARIPVFEDQGTGLIEGLEAFGVGGEPVFVKSVAAGCDLVAASGDKLLGGPQCGILLGRKQLIDQIRQDPLFRTYRVDKMAYAVLEATLHQYLARRTSEIPILRILGVSAEEIATRCARVAEAVKTPGLQVEVIATESVLGGGTAPKARVKSFAVAIRHQDRSAGDLLRSLREGDLPVIARIEDDRVVLDLRTVDESHDAALVRILCGLSGAAVPAERERN